MSTTYIVDVECQGIQARFDASVPVYYVGFLNLSNNKVTGYTNVNNAVSAAQSMLDRGDILVAHNAKFDLSVLRVRGLQHKILPGIPSILCTMTMQVFKDSSLPSFSLDALTGEKTDLLQALLDKELISVADKKTFWNTDWSNNSEVLSEIISYCNNDLRACASLYKKLIKWYEVNDKFYKQLLNSEMPMVDVLSHIEIAGANIDIQRLSDLSVQLTIELTEAETKLSEVVGLMPKLQWKSDKYEPVVKEYNNGKYTSKLYCPSYYLDADGIMLTSSPYTIYDHCPLIPFNANAATGHIWWLLTRFTPEVLKKAENTKKGKVSLTKDFFADVADDIGDNLSFSRILKLEKHLQKTEEIADNLVSGRVHSSFNCLTRTGRLSSSKPNLQNLPNPDRDKEFAPLFRGLFTAREGCVMLVADLDRIECVVLAWFLSQVEKDNGLQDIINGGLDIHQANADRWGVSRSVAKTLIFLLVYGGSPALIYKRGLAKSLEEAEAMFESVNKGQPSIQTIKVKVWKKTSERGYITNPFNAHVPYPELKSKQKWIVAAGERKSFNCLIQRTARDILHTLVLASHDICQKHGASITNIIHDEVMIEAPVDVATELMQELNVVWQARYDILKGIRVNGDFHTGDSWYTAKLG
jgi:DNA polymerase I-like protein with 3'-5' exonuclease and polymerase domains